jgi:hypothetical protein
MVKPQWCLRQWLNSAMVLTSIVKPGNGAYVNGEARQWCLRQEPKILKSGTDLGVGQIPDTLRRKGGGYCKAHPISPILHQDQQDRNNQSPTTFGHANVGIAPGHHFARGTNHKKSQYQYQACRVICNARQRCDG